MAILDDAPRSGSPRKFDDDKIAEILRVTLECEPPLATHWSTTTLAKKVEVSQPTISRIWRTFGLKPHLVQYFNISTDPNFTEKVRDVVALYLNPPDAALVLCVDEKTQIQALDRTQPVLPLRPFVPERQTHDYKRNGTTNLYAAFEIGLRKCDLRGYCLSGLSEVADPYYKTNTPQLGRPPHQRGPSQTKGILYSGRTCY